jgi:RNA polymerase sigma factor (sigma-70 family)
VKPAALLSVEQRSLVARHLGIVLGIVRALAVTGPLREEVVAVGNLALTEAVLRFDPSRGVAFTTFAYPAVHGAILRVLGKETRARRLVTFLETAPIRRPAPESSLEDALSLEPHDPAEPLVRELQLVATSTIAASSLYAALGEAAVENQHSLARIDAALERCAPLERRAFLLCRVDGHTYDECCAKLNLKPKTFQRMVERAEESVRRALVE